MVRDYRDLAVWQLSMDLVRAVYDVMKGFPKDERFRLCDQLGRAVVSIPSNIAEGNGRESKSEYARFLGIARGSLYEVETQLEIARQLGFVADISLIQGQMTSIRRMISSLIKKLRS